MSSGIKVADHVKEIIDDMRVNRSKDDALKRIRIVTLDICEEIVVKDIFKEEDLVDKGNVYEFLQNLMKCDDCKYIVYDCHYETKVSKKEDLVFIMWSSDNAKTKLKMSYASSKRCLQKLVGAKHEFEFHDMEEITPKAFAESIIKVAKADVLCLEGLDVCGC